MEKRARETRHVNQPASVGVALTRRDGEANSRGVNDEGAALDDVELWLCSIGK